ncbi:MAG: ComF family protein [Nannocystaceae bacterium]|nr:ComF family protein [Nannocystaceae bacterium]
MIALLLPPCCVACGLVLLQPRTPELCRSCAVSLAAAPPLREPDLAAVFAYDGPLGEALRRCKYGGQLALAGPLGRALAAAPGFVAERDGAPWELATWVPMPWRRRLWRGFDHARLLLRAATAAGGPRPAALLLRTRDGPPQVSLDAAARARNMDDAFAVRPRAAVQGRRVLVIDDVTTTGATLRAAIAALRTAGAARVAGLALLHRA